MYYDKKQYNFIFLYQNKMNEKYLMATIRIPVRISLDGELTLLNEYSKIEIEKMNEETEMLLTKTTDTIYSKVIEYLGMYIQLKNTSIILEEKEKEEEEKEEEEKEEEEKEEEDKEDKEKEEEEKEKEDKEDKEKEEEEKEEEDKEDKEKEEMYEFPYMKKSKKPLNGTFRERFKSQNFTKKVYSD